MLITRKVTKDKRPVVDFRLLNTRIKRHNTATPLLRDIYQMLGKAQSTVLSCVDLKDAFHSLKLTDRAKDFCGILPYFGSPHYRYEVMPMGLSISPCKWIQYIGYVMEKMPHPENYIAIMDDLLVHSRESEHMDRILDMLKALVEHGLKLSPKKCQFFRNELVYMGNTFKTGPERYNNHSHQNKTGGHTQHTQLPGLLKTAKVFVELSTMSVCFVHICRSFWLQFMI